MSLGIGCKITKDILLEVLIGGCKVSIALLSFETNCGNLMVHILVAQVFETSY